MIVVLLYFLFTSVVAKEMKLLEVVALGRHNIRTPLSRYIDKFTPKKWPSFDKPPGHLTGKGATMESHMGRYFSEWMKAEGLIDGCPREEVYIYANSLERTIDTARAFVQGAFPDCDTQVHYRNDIILDPIFKAAIQNSSKQFAEAVIEEMKEKINLEDDNLRPAYAIVNEIADFNHSQVCITDNYCDLSKQENTILLTVDRAPDIIGPLSIANSIIDVFIMSFYDGKPMNEVAWGSLNEPEQWKVLTKVIRENQNVRFNLTTASKDLTKPLLQYMAGIFLGGLNRKFSLIVGHDASINCLTNALGFEPFVLPNQYEPFPIGGKLVFQKWTDGFKVYLKVEYIYQSWLQLRHGSKLDLEHPPQIHTLEMKNCLVDKDGFCLWDDFLVLLNDTLYDLNNDSEFNK